MIGADKSPQAALPKLDEMRQRLLEVVPIGDAELRKLAAERAEKIQTYLVTRAQVSPDQVEVAVQPLAKGGTRTNLQLK